MAYPSGYTRCSHEFNDNLPQSMADFRLHAQHQEIQVRMLEADDTGSMTSPQCKFSNPVMERIHLDQTSRRSTPSAPDVSCEDLMRKVSDRCRKLLIFRRTSFKCRASPISTGNTLKATTTPRHCRIIVSPWTFLQATPPAAALPPSLPSCVFPQNCASRYTPPQ